MISEILFFMFCNDSSACTLVIPFQAIVCVEELDLEGNWLRQGGCKHLCRMLEENDSIQRLVILPLYSDTVSYPCGFMIFSHLNRYC